jgi:hypothetical protein
VEPNNQQSLTASDLENRSDFLIFLLVEQWKQIVNLTRYNFEYMDVVTGGRDCPTNSNKHTLQLNILHTYKHVW